MNELFADGLDAMGFNSAIAQAMASVTASGRLQRVLEVHRETVQVHDGTAAATARPLPWMQREFTDEQALCTGDWVITTVDEHGAMWIGERVPSFNRIVRRGSTGARQAIVANVDTALLVMGMDADFNLRRLERYVALVRGAGASPVVVLTKLDLCGQAQADLRLDALRARMPSDLPFHALDGRDANAAQLLAPYLGRGRTLVALGSSGAGKSTLTNTLTGDAAQDTGAVRAGDGRGQHTTRSRSLHCLPGGACLIDTPGLRGLRPDTDEDRLDASFGDIAMLAAQCRFRDCRHFDEPGCAVRERVDADRLLNYQKMLRDVRRDQLTPLERRQRLAQWKAMHRGAVERMKHKRGWAGR
jgi:ribosome biogenesis GTPase